MLTNARIVDVDRGKILSQTALAVRDGMIEAIFDDEQVRLAGPARRMDCRGRYLIPGLINAHCHITLPSVGGKFGLRDLGALRRQVLRNYEDALAWGITTVRDMGSMPKILQADREAIERGTRPGPRILSSVGFVTVPGGYPEAMERLPGAARAILGSPSLFAHTPGEARDHVKRFHDLGADHIKIAFDHLSNIYGHGPLNVLSDAQMEAIRSETERLGLPLAAHHMYVGGLDRGLKFGIDSMEHVAGDAALTDRQIQKVVDTKTPLIPTLTARLCIAFPSPTDPFGANPLLQRYLTWRAAHLFPDIANHCAPEIRRLCHWFIRYNREGRYALVQNRNILSSNPPIFTRGFVNGYSNLQRLIEAGARLGVGNDSGIPLLFPGMLPFEMELMNCAGMPPGAVLRAATLVNAKICRVDHRCGSIQTGKAADLVVLQGNPLTDIRNAGRVKAVFARGRLVSRAEDFAFDDAPRSPAVIGGKKG